MYAIRSYYDITCDVSINHLHLSDMDIGYFNPNCHVVPPLRSQRDRDALRQALKEGRINALCSDHTPVDDDGKQMPFSESEAGATGLELLLPRITSYNVCYTKLLRSAGSEKVMLIDLCRSIFSGNGAFV